MPIVELVVETPIPSTFRTCQLTGSFDLHSAEWHRQRFIASLPDPDRSWRIGAIVGPSGAGKTLIARAAYADAHWVDEDWPDERAIIDGLGDKPIQRLTAALTMVGLGSVPAWLRPYRALSHGEQFRCRLARGLLSDNPLVVCDEFTNGLDRTVAQTASAAIGKTLRRNGPFDQHFVAVTVHEDVLDWLEPDWVMRPAAVQHAEGIHRTDHADWSTTVTGEVRWGRLRRPRLVLQVRGCSDRLWPRFAAHHYLNGNLPRGCRCYAALWQRQAIAFCAVVHSAGHRGIKRIARLVVLPEFQGLGIGVRFSTALGQWYAEQGIRLTMTTGHPGMMGALCRSRHWRTTKFQRYSRSRHSAHRAWGTSWGRCVASFAYQAGLAGQPRIQSG